MAWFLFGIYDRSFSILLAISDSNDRFADQINRTIKLFALGSAIVASFAVVKVRRHSLCPISVD